MKKETALLLTFTLLIGFVLGAAVTYKKPITKYVFNPPFNYWDDGIYGDLPEVDSVYNPGGYTTTSGYAPVMDDFWENNHTVSQIKSSQDIEPDTSNVAISNVRYSVNPHFKEQMAEAMQRIENRRKYPAYFCAFCILVFLCIGIYQILKAIFGKKKIKNSPLYSNRNYLLYRYNKFLFIASMLFSVSASAQTKLRDYVPKKLTTKDGWAEPRPSNGDLYQFKDDLKPSDTTSIYLPTKVKLRRAYILEVVNDTTLKWTAVWDAHPDHQNSYMLISGYFFDGGDKFLYYNDKKTKVTNKVIQLIIR